MHISHIRMSFNNYDQIFSEIYIKTLIKETHLQEGDLLIHDQFLNYIDTTV